MKKLILAFCILASGIAHAAQGDLVIITDGNGTSSANRTVAPALPIALGGTGGTTPAAARINLGLGTTITTTAPLSGGGNLTSNLTLSVGNATTSSTGVVELATDAEVQTGTDTVRSIVPSSLAAWWTWAKTLAQTFSGNLTASSNFVHGDAATDEFVSNDDDPRFPNLTVSTYEAAGDDSVAINGSVGDVRYGIPNLGDGVILETQKSVSVNGTYNMNAVSVNKGITSLTRNGTTATAVSPAHGFTTGMTVTISGVSPSGYNGEHAITVVDENTFTYVMDADPGADGSGTMVARNHWVRLFEGTTGNMIAGDVTISVSAAGSRDTVSFCVSGVASTNGIGIALLAGGGWSWMPYVRVSQSGTTTRLECYMRDPTRSYSITSNWIPRAGVAPAPAFLGGSPGPYDTKQRIVAISAEKIAPIFTVNPPSIAANSYGEVGTGNDILIRPVTTSGMKMQPVAISNCLDALPTGLIFVDVRVGSLGQIIWRFYNATGSGIDSGDLRMATRAFYTVSNL